MTGTTHIKHERVVTWRWVAWLLVPGIVAHEFTHALVARQAGASGVSMDWEVPKVRMFWDGVRPVRVVVAQLAPTLVGLALGGPALAALIMAGVFEQFGLLATLWLIGNWMVYALPTVGDVTGAMTALGVNHG